LASHTTFSTASLLVIFFLFLLVRRVAKVSLLLNSYFLVADEGIV
jgi:hypothetical protein